MASRTQGIKCYHCPRVLADYKELQVHRQKCIPASGLYMCPVFPRRNVRKEAIFSHMQSHHRRQMDQLHLTMSHVNQGLP